MFFAFIILLLASSNLQVDSDSTVNQSFQRASSAETLKWVSKNNVIQSQLIPAGKEMEWQSDRPTLLYVARAMHNGEWLPGKALFHSVERDFLFYLTYNGSQFQKSEFQLLLQPAGSTSWVQMEGRVAHDHPVFGGTDPETGETNFICRALLTNENNTEYLEVGRAVPSSGDCHLSYSSEQIVTSYELLVINSYGELRNV